MTRFLKKLNKIRAFSPEVIDAEAAARKKPGFPHDKLVFAAADHNARMINEYKGNPIGLSNRRSILSAWCGMLQVIRLMESRGDRILIYLSSIEVAAEKWRKGVSGWEDAGWHLNRGGLKKIRYGEMDDIRPVIQSIA